MNDMINTIIFLPQRSGYNNKFSDTGVCLLNEADICSVQGLLGKKSLLPNMQVTFMSQDVIPLPNVESPSESKNAVSGHNLPINPSAEWLLNSASFKSTFACKAEVRINDSR